MVPLATQQLPTASARMQRPQQRQKSNGFAALQHSLRLHAWVSLQATRQQSLLCCCGRCRQPRPQPQQQRRPSCLHQSQKQAHEHQTQLGCRACRCWCASAVQRCQLILALVLASQWSCVLTQVTRSRHLEQVCQWVVRLHLQLPCRLQQHQLQTLHLPFRQRLKLQRPSVDSLQQRQH